MPAFGDKNHVGIDRRHGLVRTWLVTDASGHDGAQLPSLVPKANTASDAWADTSYRTRANEQHLAENGLRSQIHCRKPPGRAMPVNVARANGRRSKVRAAVEHVFARQKGPIGLVVRTIGIARAAMKVGPRLQHAPGRLAHPASSRAGLNRRARPGGRVSRPNQPAPLPPPSITRLDHATPAALTAGFSECPDC